MSPSPKIVTAIGLIAGACTTISFLPQLLKTWRKRSARDLSYRMLAIYAFGVFFWLLYGIFLNALPIILTNSVTLLLVSFIIGLKRHLRD